MLANHIGNLSEASNKFRNYPIIKINNPFSPPLKRRHAPRTKYIPLDLLNTSYYKRTLENNKIMTLPLVEPNMQSAQASKKMKLLNAKKKKRC